MAQAAAGAVGYAVADRPALKLKAQCLRAPGVEFDRLKPVENLIQTDGWPPSGSWPSCGGLGRMLSVSGDLGESESPPV
jgi:hypothetical protein